MKILPALAMLLMSPVAHAQLQRGDWMLGTNIGSTGITRSGGGFSDGRIINASLTPQVGRFLTDRWVVGTGVGLEYANYKNVYFLPSNISSASVSLQPFARYYFTGKKRDVIRRFIPFVEAGLGVTGFKYWEQLGNERYTSPLGVGFNANVSAGVNYFFSPTVAAEARVKYSYSNGPDISQSTGLSFELGFKVFLRGRGASLPSLVPTRP